MSEQKDLTPGDRERLQHERAISEALANNPIFTRAEAEAYLDLQKRAAAFSRLLDQECGLTDEEH